MGWDGMAWNGRWLCNKMLIHWCNQIVVDKQFGQQTKGIHHRCLLDLDVAVKA